jgi:hypothetical protein
VRRLWRRWRRWAIRREIANAYSVGACDGYLDGFGDGVEYGRAFADPFPDMPRPPRERRWRTVPPYV